jgi:hypothetical protein
MSDEELVLVKKKRGRANVIVGTRQVEAEEKDTFEVIEAEVKRGKVETKEEVIISGELAEELLAEETSKKPKPVYHKEVAQREEIVAPKKIYAIQNQTSSEAAAKPEKFKFNPDNAKPTCRFDYAKDLCKDYNESGYCVFGDTCIFLHDRGEYKSGWELELDWNKQVKEKMTEEDVKEEEVAEDPNICKICEKKKNSPLAAECGHSFCESCALSSFSLQKSCPICKKTWKGSFKVVK